MQPKIATNHFFNLNISELEADRVLSFKCNKQKKLTKLHSTWVHVCFTALDNLPFLRNFRNALHLSVFGEVNVWKKISRIQTVRNVECLP